MESSYNMMEEDRQFDLRDILASMLLGWKLILCCILAGMLLLGFVGIKVINENNLANVPDAEKIAFLRENLSEAEAVEVERVVEQYQVCQNNLAGISRSSLIQQSVDLNSKKIKVLKYYVVSDIKNINSFFTDMALSSEDYEEIYNIAYPGKTNLTNSTETEKESSPVQFYFSYNWENYNYISENDQNSVSKEATLVTVLICSDTQEQCEKIQNIIDNAFVRETSILQGLDANVVCRCIDAHYSYNGKEYYDNASRNNMDKLNTVYNCLANLKNNFIKNFTDNQTTYFEALNESGSEENAILSDNGSSETNVLSDVHHSFPVKKLVKYLALGAFAGCFLACFWLFFLYVIDNRLQTSDELGNYGLRVVDTLYYAKNKDLFHLLARKIRGISTISDSVREQLLIEDIAIMLKGDSIRNSYLIRTSDADEDIKLTQNLQNHLAANEIEIKTGNPFSSPEELKRLSESDSIIVITHIKDTKRETIKRITEICDRYHKRISGAVAIELF